MIEKIEFRVPGKVIVNGSYIVLSGETCRAVALKTHMTSEATRTVSSEAEITVAVDGGEKITYGSDYIRTCRDTGGPAHYILNIVACFFEIARISPKNRIHIEMHTGEGFFSGGPGGEKTGIGSSACILVSIVYALLRFHQDDFRRIASRGDFDARGRSPVFQGDLKLWLGGLSLSEDLAEHLLSITYLVHQATNQGASGCDVMCCLLGSIYFSRERCFPLENIPRYLILGSFGKSSATREMLKKINSKDPKWRFIKDINRKINEERESPKKLYMEYLDAMKGVSTAIVPEKQYEVLMKTNGYDIWGCGISGAGGDDCVWALADDYQDVYRYWKRVFTFTFVTEVSYRGIHLL
ncbi:similarity to MEVALONATE KINASE [Encephalitozoon cuniculi GB-M1]|uniref:phosphomevalonate kinase n=1 Tax=Encephalitozoon cuniculi (strain GB-M1) TaxID=284813 RepID=Q8SUB3_ENCCU|nr:uncharacterized protein ECU10_1510 [Encephalitozoon cuniculi GB-M1]CAD25871.1 similarity to MEVALONATE KINASE [Encephalitozoon cuniculi GB-M1]